MAELWGRASQSPRRTIVVVTASNDKQAAAVEQELAARRQSGCFGPDVLLFAVPDPSSARVGSGGATFNALVTVQELVSSSLDIEDCLVVCIHSGGDSQRMYTQSVTGKAWSALPSLSPAEQQLDAPIDLLLRCLLNLFRDVPAGFVVASSDVLLLMPEDFTVSWPQQGATGLAIPTDKALGPNHGVYQVAPAAAGEAAAIVAPVGKFWQKATVAEMQSAGAVRPDGTVLIDSGVIYFSPPATSSLLSLAVTHPLECCTYQGLDSHRRPLRIELYSDLMMAMGGGMGLTRSEYGAIASSEAHAGTLALARDIMWEALKGMPFFAAVVEGGGFSHVGTTVEYLQLLTAPTPAQARHGLLTSAAWFEDGAPIEDLQGGSAAAAAAAAASSPSTSGAATGPVVLNSLFRVSGHLGSGSVVEHSELTGDWRIGHGCLVSAVRSLPYLTVRNGIALQETRIPGKRARVVTLLGVADPIKDPFTKASARVCGMPWATIFAAAAVEPADIWGAASSADPASCTLWTAKLWPVFAAATSDHLSVPTGPSTSAECDPVTADRASLWLQWLGVPEDGEGLAAAASSLGLTPDQLQHVRRAHLAPRIISAWRDAERFSLRDILGEADASVEFAWRRALRGRIDVALLIACVSQGSSVSIADLVRRLGHGALPSSTLGESTGAAGDVRDSAGSSSSSGNAQQAAFARAALHGLDALARTCTPDLAGRALSVQSALLWAMAGWGTHGHRSGPAHNAEWLSTLALLDGDANAGGGGAATAGPNSPRAAGIARLGALRDSWLHRAHLTGRAARHYERAAQLLTSQCVYTAPVGTPTPSSLPAVGAWVTAACPVRVDLAGGWSDTPPVTYEARALKGGAAALANNAGALSVDACAAAGGGLVVNIAVRLDGANPLGARVRRVLQPTPAAGTSSPVIIVRTRASGASSSSSGDDDIDAATAAAAAAAAMSSDGAPGRIISTVELSSLGDLGDYFQPHAQGALVKCALLVLGLVRLPRVGAPPPPDLATQLADLLAARGGEKIPPSSKWCLEVETWSLVPQGSGLGTSSILAGAVLAALGAALGVTHERSSLVHLVLKLEQMLTTGGGWQDQVGGLWPGIKASWCAPALPLVVRVLPLSGSAGSSAGDASPPPALFTHAPLVALLNSHAFLLYTGRTRLAKNLLQRVLRQWAVRENGITATVESLRATAADMANALAALDIPRIGTALDAYWAQKKRMAPLAEPAEVTAMIAALRPHIHGASLAGAGGGGFLFGITKVPGTAADGTLERALRAAPLTARLGFSLHACTVDTEGLVVGGV